MAGRIRDHDWATTPLGPIDSWPDRLRHAVELVLAMPYSACVSWGPDLLQIYNDRNIPNYGDRHPQALGQPLTEAIAESAEVFGSIRDRVFADRSPVAFEDQPFSLPGPGGTVVTRWFTGGWTPIRGESGEVLGILRTAVDTTDRVMSRAALHDSEAALRQVAARDTFRIALTDALRTAAGPEEAQAIAMRMLGDHLGIGRVMYAEADPGSPRSFTNYREYRRDPAMPSSLGTHRWDDFGRYGAAELRAGRTLVVGDVRFHGEHSPEELAAYEAVGIRACLAVPLVRGGTIVAYLAVNQGEERAWTAEEIALTQEVAERTWDAVERARAAAAVGGAEERLRLVVEGARDYVIFTTDTDGRIADWYAGAQAVFGYRPDEVSGRDYATIFTPEDRAAGAPEKELALARAQGFAPDTRWHLCKDGSRVFVDGRIVALSDGSGAIKGFVKIGLDVTRRHLVEEALRDSEERFRQFAECLSDVIWIRNADTLQFEYVSPAIEAIYGVSVAAFRAERDDLDGWAGILHPDDRAHALGVFDDVRKGHRVTHEFRIQRPDGAERWIRDTDFPLLDSHGQVQRFAGIGEDVTDLKHAEAAIAESEMRLRVLTEGIPQLVWRSCNKGRWTWASPQWCDFTGQTQGESHGMGWLDVVHPDDRFATMKAWEDARPTGTLDTEYRVLRARDRAWVWHHTRSVPVRDAAGAITEWLGTSTDIQALRELQERQGVLVAELQHRTRNLIGVVRSVADKSIRAAADLPDFRERFGHRMQALSRVQGLLSRLGEGERVTFDTLLRAELTAMDAADDPRVTIDGPHGVTLRSGSVQTLAMAIHELATNAVKYGALNPAAPQARLQIGWWVLTPDGEPRPRLRIEWIETGVVMPPTGSTPPGSGQGRELIERALPYQLDAKTTYVLESDGVACSIIVPISFRVFEDRVHA